MSYKKNYTAFGMNPPSVGGAAACSSKINNDMPPLLFGFSYHGNTNEMQIKLLGKKVGNVMGKNNIQCTEIYQNS